MFGGSKFFIIYNILNGKIGVYDVLMSIELEMLENFFIGVWNFFIYFKIFLLLEDSRRRIVI